MCAHRVVASHVTRQHMTQVPLPKHNDMVQALPADRAYQSFGIAILLG